MTTFSYICIVLGAYTMARAFMKILAKLEGER